MKKKLFIIPSLTASMIVIVTVLLFFFWHTQESKFYIIQLAFPLLLFVALFYIIAFNSLGSAQVNSDSPSILKVLYSATLVVGLFALLLFLGFVTISRPPEGAIGSMPGAFVMLRGVLSTVFVPFWCAYISGGLVQYLFIKGSIRRL